MNQENKSVDPELEHSSEIVKTSRKRTKYVVDRHKWELKQGSHEPLFYKSLKDIFADRKTHGLYRNQVKSMLKTDLKSDSQEKSPRLGYLRLRPRKERLKKVSAVPQACKEIDVVNEIEQ